MLQGVFGARSRIVLQTPYLVLSGSARDVFGKLHKERPGLRVVVSTNSLAATVSVIETGTNTVVGTVPVGSAPEGTAVNSTGSRVYVSNYSSNSVSVIDTATNSVISTVTVGTGPDGIAVAYANDG